MNGNQTGRKLKKNQPNLEAINNDLESSHLHLGFMSRVSRVNKRREISSVEQRSQELMYESSVFRRGLETPPPHTHRRRAPATKSASSSRRGMKGGSRQPRECPASEFFSPGSSELFSEAGEGWGLQGVNAGNRAKYQASLEGTRGGLSG